MSRDVGSWRLKAREASCIEASDFAVEAFVELTRGTDGTGKGRFGDDRLG